MARQLALDRRGVADENEPDLQVPRSDERTVDDAARGVVAAHGIYSYTHARGSTGFCQILQGAARFEVPGP
jgi:hypothetical protein